MIKALKALKESGDWKTILFHSSWSLTLPDFYKII
jgi:hypothetical protein